MEMMWKRIGLAAMVAGICFGSYAQDIVVMDAGSYKIDNGAPEGTLLPVTTFQDELVGDTGGLQFYIDNDSFSGLLNVSNITITGANPGDFVLLDSPGPYDIPAKPAQDGVLLTVQFNPSALGLRTAQLNIFSNDPDDESVYSFTLAGTGVLEKVTEVPNLRIELLQPKNVKISKEGKVTVKGKVIVQNYGFGQSDLSMVEIYISQKNYFDETATLVKIQNVKKLKGHIQGKTSSRKVKYKANGNGYPEGYIYAISWPSVPSIDGDYSNNLSKFRYPDYDY